ncbi:unnamed protein product [Leptidea sinapis]|uniref:Uncharacterized protein n=1 Tax=Leptidea sinapis TaxID=189913 RepID=A0A5E4Q1E1_9NEOP|nr:unnamed protein product [Leptidea sinapis]
MIVVFFLCSQTTVSYKTLKEFKEQFKEVQNDKEFSTSDAWVGKAMDFIYSNKTMMNILARELWEVGSRTIDKIVGMKGKVEK